MGRINKFGLTDYISPATKKKIREEAGYGCVMCGSAIYQYEHIEPEFCNAEKHDPEKMTLLCGGCHEKVTKRIISKKRVWEAKKNPVTFKQRCIKGQLDCDFSNFKVTWGNFNSIGAARPFIIANKPILWFEKTDDKDDPQPIKLCAIFYRNSKEPFAYINRNEYIGLIDQEKVHFECQGTSIKIKYENKTILHLVRAGDENLYIKILNLNYMGCNLQVDENGLSFNAANGGGLSLINCAIANTGNEHAAIAHFGSIEYGRINNCSVLEIVTLISRTGSLIYNYANKIVGYILDNFIFNKKYEIVGKITNKKVYLLSGEFVGIYKNCKIGLEDTSYESGEPIWVLPQQRAVMHVLKNFELYDLSYRFFGE